MNCNRRSASSAPISPTTSIAARRRWRHAGRARVRGTRAVLDTVTLLAYLGGAGRGLGTATRRIFERARAGRVRLAVPTVCLFEVAQLEERGRITLTVAFERWCDLVEHTEALVV